METSNPATTGKITPQDIWNEVKALRSEFNEFRKTVSPTSTTRTSNKNSKWPFQASASANDDPKFKTGRELPDPRPRQSLSGLERTQFASSHENKTQAFEDELSQKKQLYDDTYKQNQDMQKQLTEQADEIKNLHNIILRAGRSKNAPVDDDINRQFMRLNSEIMQMVKCHLVSEQGIDVPEASPDLPELRIRQKLAIALYRHFFSRDASLFGFEDRLLSSNPMRLFEQKLRSRHCDESVIKEWRIATVNAGKFLEPDIHNYAAAVSHQIWTEDLQHHISHSSGDSDIQRTLEHLDGLCRRAAELAILFRGSPIEYEWEQDMSRPRSLEFISGDHEVIGTEGPLPNKDLNYKISFVVFGGVVRGDKVTGLLANGSTRIVKSKVVIGYC